MQNAGEIDQRKGDRKREKESGRKKETDGVMALNFIQLKVKVCLSLRLLFLSVRTDGRH